MWVENILGGKEGWDGVVGMEAECDVNIDGTVLLGLKGEGAMGEGGDRRCWWHVLSDCWVRWWFFDTLISGR